jgi:hypothetical protein
METVPKAAQEGRARAEGMLGIARSVPASVPKPGPRTINRQPTPTNDPIKNGPEIVDFRPVL